MESEYPAIGMYHSDDLYFFFEQEGIDMLKEKGSIKGVFSCPNNQPPQKLIRMDLIVLVRKPSIDCYSTDVDISHKKKQVLFTIMEKDFINNIFAPDGWTRDNGPAWRDALSANIYIKQASSYEAIKHKDQIMKVIDQTV